MERTNEFKLNTAFLTLATILNKGLLFLAIPFFSSWLSIEDYGRFDLYYTYISLLVPIITLTTAESLFRFNIDCKDSRDRSIYINSCFFICFMNSTLAFIALLLYGFKNDNQMLFFYFGIYLLAEVMMAYLNGYLRSIKRLDIYSICMCITTILIIISVFILVKLFDMGLCGMILGYAIGTWSCCILICLKTRWNKMLNIQYVKTAKCIAMIKYAAPLIPNNISWWIMNASDRQIINTFFGDAANGIYAIAHKIPNLCSAIFNMVGISWQQEAIKRIDDDDCEHYMNTVFNKMLVMLCSFCSCLLAGSYILYNFIFDNKYYDGRLYSPILILSALLMALSQFVGGIQIALKQPLKNGITTVLGAITNIILHLLLVTPIKLYAAAISTLLANFIILFVRLLFVRDKLKVHFQTNTILAVIAIMYFLFMVIFVDEIFVSTINILFSVLLFVLFNKSLICSIFGKHIKKFAKCIK